MGCCALGELWPWHSGGPLTLPQIREMVDRLFEAGQPWLGELVGWRTGARIAGGKSPGAGSVAARRERRR